MKCQNCGADLPTEPQRAVRDGMLDEVVAHTFDPDGLAVSQTDYYCNLRCAAAEWSPPEEEPEA